MKYAILLILFALSGCRDYDEPARHSHLPNMVGRFTDGDVTCWSFHQDSISCVKDAHPEQDQ